MSSTIYKLHYHFVWATKNRAQIITPEIEKLINNYIPDKTKNLSAKLLAVNMVSDHLHLVAIVPPAMSLSTYVNFIKGGSSHHVNTIRGERSFFWQTGYGVFCFEENSLPFVVSYVQNQKQRHADKNLIELYEKIPVD